MTKYLMIPNYKNCFAIDHNQRETREDKVSIIMNNKKRKNLKQNLFLSFHVCWRHWSCCCCCWRYFFKKSFSLRSTLVMMVLYNWPIYFHYYIFFTETMIIVSLSFNELKTVDFFLCFLDGLVVSCLVFILVGCDVDVDFLAHEIEGSFSLFFCCAKIMRSGRDIWNIQSTNQITNLGLIMNYITSRQIESRLLTPNRWKSSSTLLDLLAAWLTIQINPNTAAADY